MNMNPELLVLKFLLMHWAVNMDALLLKLMVFRPIYLGLLINPVAYKGSYLILKKEFTSFGIVLLTYLLKL